MGGDDFFDVSIADEFPLELMNDPAPVCDEPSRDSSSAMSLLNPDDYSASQSTLTRSTSAYTASSAPVIHAADRGMYLRENYPRYPDDSSQARESITESSYFSREVGLTVHESGDSDTEVMEGDIHELESFDEEERRERISHQSEGYQRSSTMEEIRSYSQQSVDGTQAVSVCAEEDSQASDNTSQSLQRLSTMQELLQAQHADVGAPSTPSNAIAQEEEDEVFSPSLPRGPESSISRVSRPPRPIQPNMYPDPRLTESSDSRRDATIRTESSQASEDQRVV